MKILCTLILCAAVHCAAQVPCSPNVLTSEVARVHSLQEQLKRVQSSEIETTVPAMARDLLMQLKDALSKAADAAMDCAAPSVNTSELETKLAEALNANPPQPPLNTVISKDDHRFDEAFGSYGHNLRVLVSKPPNATGLLQIEFSINIACGEDHLLLIYFLDHRIWSKLLRWQAPPLKEISDAFGDFFLSAVLAPPENGDKRPRVAVAHGHP